MPCAKKQVSPPRHYESSLASRDLVLRSPFPLGKATPRPDFSKGEIWNSVRKCDDYMEKCASLSSKKKTLNLLKASLFVHRAADLQMGFYCLRAGTYIYRPLIFIHLSIYICIYLLCAYSSPIFSALLLVHAPASYPIGLHLCNDRNKEKSHSGRRASRRPTR